jgi:hypothetical protein
MIKPALFLLLILISIFSIKERVDKNTKLIFLILSIVIPMYGFIVSIVRGNMLRYALSDANGYVFLITGYFFILLIKKNNKLKDTIKLHLLIATLIVSLLTILMFSLVYIGKLNIIDVNSILKNEGIGLASIENGNYRIFLGGQIYVLLTALYVFNKLIDNKTKINKGHIGLFFIYVIALILSNTRSYWIAMFIGIGLSILLQKFSIKKIVTIILIFLVTWGTILRLPQEYVSNSLDRIQSITDFSRNNISNYNRILQSSELLYEFKLYPILGKGFGATLTDGYTRNIEAPYTFELSYLELLYKLGIVGMTLFVLALMLGLIKFYNVKDNFMISFLVSTYLSFLFVSSTNPFIVSGMGIFLLALLFVFSETVDSVKQQ